MRILLISPIPIFPQNAGNRSRILSLSRQLVEAGAEVEFCYLDMLPREKVDEAAMRTEYGQGYHRFAGTAPAFRGRAGPLLRRVLRKLGVERAFHYGLDDWFDERLLPDLRRLAAAGNYDVVINSYVFTSRALEAFPAALKVLDTHDAFALRNARRPGGGRSTWYSTSKQDELAGFRRADRIIAMQDGEAAQFRAGLGADGPPVVTVGHVPMASAYARSAPEGEALFIGANNEANLEALSYYLEAIHPIITAADPGFRLLVAGSICRVLADDLPVVKLGEFAQPSDVLLKAPLLINPMRSGTGMNIKILEAIAHGVPVVSTRTGVRGLDSRFLGGMTVAADDDAAGFAAGILALCRSPEAWGAAAGLMQVAAQRWTDLQRKSLGDAVEPA